MAAATINYHKIIYIAANDHFKWYTSSGWQDELICGFCFYLSVPQKVSELKADSSMGWLRALRVTWVPPAGEWEKYYIVLFNDSSTVLLNTTVQKEKTEYVIKDIGLIPGKQYDVAVIVESGGLQNIARCEGRTGKQFFITVNRTCKNIKKYFFGLIKWSFHTLQMP